MAAAHSSSPPHTPFVTASGDAGGAAAAGSEPATLRLAVGFRLALLFGWALAAALLGLNPLLLAMPLALLLISDSLRNAQQLAQRRRLRLQRQLLDSRQFLQLLRQFPVWVSFGEQEQSRLMNSILRQLWPVAKIATEQTVLTAMQPIFASIKPSFLTSLGLDIFDLGTTPPTIEAVNLVTTNEGVALDLQINFSGENNIVLVMGIPARFSVRLKSLEASVQVRVLLANLTKDLPCFEALAISLVRRPIIKFKLQPLGLPLSTIPGLEDFIFNMVNDILVSMLLWPNKLVIPVVPVATPFEEDPLANRSLPAPPAKVRKQANNASPAASPATKRASGDKASPRNSHRRPGEPHDTTAVSKAAASKTTTATSGATTPLTPVAGTAVPQPAPAWMKLLYPLQFIFPPPAADPEAQYRPPSVTPETRNRHYFNSLQTPLAQGVLHVEVLRAFNLQNTDLLSLSDPYCVISLDGVNQELEDRRTAVKKDDLSPVWEESHYMLVDDLATQLLHLKLFDYDTGRKDTSLGYCTVSLRSLPISQPVTFRKEVVDGTGSIEFRLEFRPFIAEGVRVEKTAEAGKGEWPSAFFVQFATISGLTSRKAVSLKVAKQKSDKPIFKSYPVEPLHNVATITQSFRFFAPAQEHAVIKIELSGNLGELCVDLFASAGEEWPFTGRTVDFPLPSGAVLAMFICARRVPAGSSAGAPQALTRRLSAHAQRSGSLKGLAVEAEAQAAPGAVVRANQSPAGGASATAAAAAAAAAAARLEGRVHVEKSTRGPALLKTPALSVEDDDDADDQATVVATSTSATAVGRAESTPTPTLAQQLAASAFEAKQALEAAPAMAVDIVSLQNQVNSALQIHLTTLTLIGMILVSFLVMRLWFMPWWLAAPLWIAVLVYAYRVALRSARHRLADLQESPDNVVDLSVLADSRGKRRSGDDILMLSPEERAKARAKELRAQLDREQLRLQLLQDLPSWAVYPDMEKAEWLNELLVLLHPHIKNMVKDLVRQTVFDLKPMLRPYLSDLEVELDLGTQPPLINGLFMYSDENTLDQIVFDVDVAMGGDFSCSIKAVMTYFALPIELENLHFEGRLRIALRDMVTTYPCFSQVDVSFVETPKVDFKLTVGYIPITSLPFTPFAIRSVVGFLLGSMRLMYPNKMAVEILDVNDVLLNRHARQQGLGIIRVWVDRAHKLRNVDWGFNNKSDPYVSVVLYDRQAIKVKTKVIDDNLNPVWNEYFEFVLQSSPRPLVFTVKDSDRIGKNEVLGTGEINTEDLEKAENVLLRRTFPFTHKEKPAGSMDIRVEYKPFLSSVPQDFWEQEISSARDSNASAVKAAAAAAVNNLAASNATVKAGGAAAEPAEDVSRPSVAVLFVTVLHGRGMDSSGTKVTLSLGNTTFETKRATGRNPVFDETFFLLVRNIATDRLILTVQGENKLRRTKQSNEAAEDLLDLARAENIQKQYTFGHSTLHVRYVLRAISPERRGESNWDDYMKAFEQTRETHEKALAEMTPKSPLPAAGSGQLAVPAAVIPEARRPGFLYITLVEGKNLPAANTNGFSDPYVTLRIGRHHERSSVCKRTVNPTWNERFTFKVGRPNSAQLIIHLKDKEYFHVSNKFIAEFIVPVKEIPSIEETRTLNVPNRGILIIKMTYQEDLTRSVASTTPRRSFISRLRRRKHKHDDSASGDELASNADQSVANHSIAEQTSMYDDDDDDADRSRLSIDTSRANGDAGLESEMV